MEIVSIFHLLITKYRSNDLGSLTIRIPAQQLNSIKWC